MPIEIRHGDTLLGGLVALDRLGRRYRGEIAGESWIFAGGFRQKILTAHQEGSGATFAIAYRAGFRRKGIELASGAVLEWRQRGWVGRRYELGWTDGPVLITALNTGGMLRWTGDIRLKSLPAELEDAIGFLLLFVPFLVFNSLELHFG